MHLDASSARVQAILGREQEIYDTEQSNTQKSDGFVRQFRVFFKGSSVESFLL